MFKNSSQWPRFIQVPISGPIYPWPTLDIGSPSEIIPMSREVRRVKRWLFPFAQLILVMRTGKWLPKGEYYLGQTAGVLWLFKMFISGSTYQSKMLKIIHLIKKYIVHLFYINDSNNAYGEFIITEEALLYKVSEKSCHYI